MPDYTLALPQPSRAGFKLKAKPSVRRFVTGRGGVRQRKMSTGDRYLGTFTFSFKKVAERDAFRSFVENDLSMATLWFSANWLNDAGFTGGEWYFRFIDLKFTSAGTYGDYSCDFMMRPASAIDSFGNIDGFGLIETDWPSQTFAEVGDCGVILSNLVTYNAVQVTYNGDDVVYGPQFDAIAPTALIFSYATATAADLPNTAIPLTGDIHWEHLTEETYQTGDDYFSADLYGAPPTTTLFGLTESAMGGSIVPKPYVPQCISYISWTNFSADILAAISFGAFEVTFGFQQVYRTTNIYPRTQINIACVDCFGNEIRLEEGTLVESTGTPGWQQVEVSTNVPSGTTELRFYFLQKRGDGSISTIYSRIDNILIAYRTC